MVYLIGLLPCYYSINFTVLYTPMTPDMFCFKQCFSVSIQLHPRLDSHPLKHLYMHEDNSVSSLVLGILKLVTIKGKEAKLLS